MSLATNAPLRNSHHCMIYMTTKYKRKLKANRPTEKTIAAQSENTFDILNACFNLINWSVFAKKLESINEITEIVDGYITFNEERLSKKKVIEVFGNDKPWTTSSLRKKIVDKHSSFSQNTPNYNGKQKEEYAIYKAKKCTRRKYNSTSTVTT